MGLRVQRWVNRWPVAAFGLGIGVALALFTAGMLWLNSTDPTFGGAPALTNKAGQAVQVGDTIAQLRKDANGHCVADNKVGVDVTTSANADSQVGLSVGSDCQVTVAQAQLLAVHPASTYCNHQNRAEMEDLSFGGILEIANEVIMNWNQICGGAYPGHVTSGSYWCSWNGSSGYTAKCSAWLNSTHVETDAWDWAPVGPGYYWHQAVGINTTLQGKVTYGCWVIAGNIDTYDYIRCTEWARY